MIRELLTEGVIEPAARDVALAAVAWLTWS